MKKVKQLLMLIIGFVIIISVSSCGLEISTDSTIITNGDNQEGISIEDDSQSDDSSTTSGDSTSSSDDTSTTTGDSTTSEDTSGDNTSTESSVDTTTESDSENGTTTDSSSEKGAADSSSSDSEAAEESSEEEVTATSGYTLYNHTSDSLPYYFEYDSESYDFNIYYKDGTLLDDYLVYSSSDQYDSFASLDNAEDMRLAYLNALAKSLVISLYDDYTATSISTSSASYYQAYTIKTSTSDYTIDIDDAATIWAAVEADHPLFYWIENSYLYTSSQIYVVMADSFITYSTRVEANEDIIDGISSVASSVSSLDEYDTIKYIYTYVIENTEYAYDSSGNASSEVEAHSVVGFFQGENVVCEGYAKVLQMIYNYVGITNYYIRGYVSSTSYGHAWNYVYYDGAWYWIDATNDDEGTYSNYSMFLLGSKRMSQYKYYTYDDTIGATYQGGLPTLSSKSYGSSSSWFR